MQRLHRVISILASRWWVGLGGIIILSGAIRFAGFTYGLPYFENADEPWFFYEAAYQRGLIATWQHPNPSPGLMVLYKAAQIGAEALTHESALHSVAGIVTAIRFASVIASLVTLLLVALCARALAGNNAGWLAAVYWGIIPLVVYHSAIAIAEPWMMLFGALALYTAAFTLSRDRTLAPLISVWAGLLAFTFKYSMFSFAGIGLVVALWNLWSQPGQRRYWVRIILFQLASIVIVLGVLILAGGLLNDLNNPSREMAHVTRNPLARLTELGMIPKVVNGAFWQLGTTPLLFAGLYLVAFWLILRQCPLRMNRLASIWLMFGALGVFNMLLVPFYLLYDGTLLRYLFAADLIFVILAAGAVCILYDHWRIQFARVSRHPALRAGGVIILILWLGPLLTQSLADTYERIKPYTLADMTVWASTTLGSGSVLAEQLGYRAFSIEFGGYTGPFRSWIYGVDFLSKSLDYWRKDGYRYLEATTDIVQSLQQKPEGRAFLQQLLELRRFPPQNTDRVWTGPSFVVYQLNRPLQTADLRFGEAIRLVGVDGVQTSAKPGETLLLRFYWQALHAPDDNYALFIHMTPADQRNRLIAQIDSTPGPTKRPTLTWVVPSETLVSEPFNLAVPNDLAAGVYNIWIGLYNPYTGQRVSTPEGDSNLLAKLTVAAG